MDTFEARWDRLKASGSGEEEARRVEELQSLVHDDQIRYTLSAADARTGSPVPATDLGTNPDVKLVITVTIDKRAFTWQPLDPANVLPMLRE
jgi:hypothetical protein